MVKGEERVLGDWGQGLGGRQRRRFLAVRPTVIPPARLQHLPHRLHDRRSIGFEANQVLQLPSP